MTHPHCPRHCDRYIEFQKMRRRLLHEETQTEEYREETQAITAALQERLDSGQHIHDDHCIMARNLAAELLQGPINLTPQPGHYLLEYEE